jgi:hypothetical protein
MVWLSFVLNFTKMALLWLSEFWNTGFITSEATDRYQAIKTKRPSSIDPHIERDNALRLDRYACFLHQTKGVEDEQTVGRQRCRGDRRKRWFKRVKARRLNQSPPSPQ